MPPTYPGSAAQRLARIFQTAQVVQADRRRIEGWWQVFGNLYSNSTGEPFQENISARFVADLLLQADADLDRFKRDCGSGHHCRNQSNQNLLDRI